MRLRRRLGSEQSTHPCGARRGGAGRILRRGAALLHPAAGHTGAPVPAAGVAAAARDPLRGHGFLLGDRAGDRTARGGARGGAGQRRQPARDRDSLPSCDRRRRQAHRLRGWAVAQACLLDLGTAARSRRALPPGGPPRRPQLQPLGARPQGGVWNAGNISARMRAANGALDRHRLLSLAADDRSKTRLPQPTSWGDRVRELRPGIS